MSESPYQLSPAAPHGSDREAGANPRTLLPFAQLGLRLLGVMLVVDGLAAIAGGAIQGLLQAQAYAQAGYDIRIDPHSVGWAAGGVAYLVVGVYLVVGGNWVLQNVFMSSRREDADVLTHSNVNSREPGDAPEPPS